MNGMDENDKQKKNIWRNIVSVNEADHDVVIDTISGVDGILQTWGAFLLSIKINSRKAYGSAIVAFSEFMDITPQEALKFLLYEQQSIIADKIKIFMVNMKIDGKSPTTIAARIYALRGWLNFCRRKGLTTNTMEDMRIPSPSSVRDMRGPSLEECRALWAALQSEGSQWRAIFRLMLDVGLRAAEVLALRVEDIENNKLRVTRKGGKTTFETLPEPTVAELNEWLAVRGSGPEWIAMKLGDAGMVFPGLHYKTLYRFLAALGKRVIGKNIRPNGMRHAHITILSNTIKDLYGAKLSARHKDVRTTLIYDDLLPKNDNDIEKRILWNRQVLSSLVMADA